MVDAPATQASARGLLMRPSATIGPPRVRRTVRRIDEAYDIVSLVLDRTDSTPVSTAACSRSRHAHGTGEFGIAISERRGQGLGREATRLVLDFAFHVLELRNVLLERWSTTSRR